MNKKMKFSRSRWRVFVAGFIFSFLSTIVIHVSTNTLLAQDCDTVTTNPTVQFLHHRLLNQLPFRGLPQEYYGLLPGVVRQDYRGIENLHVRGSRPDEIAYSFEGVDIRSAYTGRNMFRIIPEALDQITLHTSPSASESHASVLFQHRLKRGGDHFSLQLRGETDRFTNSYEQRLGTFSYGYYNLLLLTEGKIFKDNIRFFIAGEGESFADHYRKFWDGFSIGGTEFPLIDYTTKQSLNQLVGTDKIVIESGNIPNANADQLVLHGIIEADYTPFVLRAIGLYNWEKQEQNNSPISQIFNQRKNPILEQNAGLISLQMDYAGARDLNAHLQFDLLRSGNKTYDPIFGDNFTLYYDSLANVNKGIPWNPCLSSYEFYYFYFSRPGRPKTSYSKSIENDWSLLGSLQKKFGPHQLSFGGAFQKRTIRQFSINSMWNYKNEYQKLGLVNGNYPPNQLLRLRNLSNVYALGYDVFGEKIDKTDEVNDGPRHPINYSFYLEDQFVSEKFQLDLGLRYDCFNSDEPIFRDPANPGVIDVWYSETEGYAPNANILPNAMIKSSSQKYLLPRFNASYFMNDRLKFNFAWGKYAQQVRFSDVYSSRTYHYKHFLDGYFYNDPHGIDARPVTSTQMQAGICYQIQNDLKIDANVFQKISEGHLETDRVVANWDASISNYFILANTGESISKGIELSLEYNHKGLYSWLNYTLSDVTGFNSYPTSNLAEVEKILHSGNVYARHSQEMSPLDYNQRHRINALLNYEFDKTNSNWFAGTGLYLLFRFNSGHNFTLYDGGFG